MIQEKLIQFLAGSHIYENERSLFLSLDKMLQESCLVRPILFFSTRDKIDHFSLKKCRSVFGKNDRVSLYSPVILEQLCHGAFNKKSKYEELKIEGVFYYYLKLGVKNGQIYFAVFSCPKKVDHLLLNALAGFYQNQLNLIKKIEQLIKNQELIHIDDVTGLYNQRKLFIDLEKMVERFSSYQEPFCVLFIDIDYFKRVNDNYGHLVGTKLLEELSILVKNLLRETDSMYRYGGDEFVIILQNTLSEGGKLVGERILKQVKENLFKIKVIDQEVPFHLSVSIGVSEFPHDAKNKEEILQIADRMMYEAKESGRGNVFNTQDVFKTALSKVMKEGQ